MKWFGILIISFLAFNGCLGPIELKSQHNAAQESTPDEGDDDTDAGDGVTISKSLYVTGVEYPEGVDWRSDLGYTSQGVILFLMKDSVRIVELTVGYDNFVSADADMHRCLDGHLYTDFSTENETVVLRDGEEIFRYNGREMINSMAVRDDGVYSLGVPRSGSGWTYRLNGQLLLGSNSGTLVHGLYEANLSTAGASSTGASSTGASSTGASSDMGSSLCFSYSEAAAIGSGKLYYVVADGQANLGLNNSGSLSVDDIRIIDGMIYYIAGSGSTTGRALYNDTGSTAIEQTVGATMYGDMEILHDGGPIVVWGSVGAGAGVWNPTSPMLITGSGRIIGISLSGEDCYYVTTSTSGGAATSFGHNEELRVFPQGYDYVYRSCIAADGARFCVGMTRVADDRPALWIDGDITDLDFNGVITGINYF